MAPIGASIVENMKSSKSKPIELKELLNDINGRIPLDDKSVKFLSASYLYEIVDNPINFMNEVDRVLQVGGEFTIYSPYYSCAKAWQDPTCKRGVSEASMAFLSKEWRELNDYKINFKGNFIIKNVSYNLTPEYIGKSQDAIQYALTHFINVAMDVVITLKKVS